MKKITVRKGQNLVDIAIMQYGAAEGIFKIAADNGIEIGQELTPGQILSIDENEPLDPAIVGYFSEDDRVINTGSVTENKGKEKVFDSTFDDSFE